MLALIRMDWTLQRRSLLYASPLLLIWLAAGASAPGQLIGSAFLIALFAAVMPVFPYLGPRTLEPFLWALPVSRAQIVAARYVSAVLSLVVALLVPFLMGWALHVGGIQEFRVTPMSDIAGGIALAGVVWSVLLFLYFPFHFRLGGQRGMSWFLGAYLAAAALAILRYGWGAFSLVQDAFTRGIAQMESPAGVARVLLGLGLLGLGSLALSVRFYERRGAGTLMPPPEAKS